MPRSLQAVDTATAGTELAHALRCGARTLDENGAVVGGVVGPAPLGIAVGGFDTRTRASGCGAMGLGDLSPRSRSPASPPGPGPHRIPHAGPGRAQVFEVLAHPVSHRNRVVTKEELIDNVWGGRFVSEAAVTSRIKQAAALSAMIERRADPRRAHVHGRRHRPSSVLPAGGAQALTSLSTSQTSELAPLERHLRGRPPTSCGRRWRSGIGHCGRGIPR
jgi:hypothetical protein